MKSVCFSKYFTMDFSGKVYPSAITLGDVDNDGRCELIIGDIDGDLSIYKERKCIQVIKGLGMITALGVGDALNCGSNVLVVFCGDGWCHIFLCLNSDNSDESKLQAVHVQRVPANTKVLLLADIDKDGSMEVVVGLSDRVVRSYRWTQNVSGGKLICLNKWECADQIGNITLNYDREGRPCLLISQPGGTFMRIRCHSNQHGNSDKMVVDYQPLSSQTVQRNARMSSEIMGRIGWHYGEPSETPYAIATLDGILMLVINDQIRWSMNIDHQLFAMGKMDVTGNGREEIIVCSWEGHTFIIDVEGNAVRFQIEHPVAAFFAGLYATDSEKPAAPCLIYVTYPPKIYVYYDVHLPKLKCESMLTVKNDPMNALCEEIIGKGDVMAKRRLITRALYHTVVHNS